MTASTAANIKSILNHGYDKFLQRMRNMNMHAKMEIRPREKDTNHTIKLPL